MTAHTDKPDSENMSFVSVQESQSTLSSTLLKVWPFFLGLILLIPSIRWIVFDRHVWHWDQAWYGEVALNLWYTLIRNPENWWAEMVHAFGMKAPGIAWFGQFFVPLSSVFGSPERALLTAVLVPQFFTLLLAQKIGLSLSQGNRWLSTTAALAMGSAPLFIGMSHQFLTETLQVLGVTYFYYLACTCREKSKISVIGHLFSATSIAIIAKTTSPFHCFFPGIIVVLSLIPFKKSKNVVPQVASNKRSLVFASFSIVPLGLSSAWYVENFQKVLEFTSAAGGELSLPYGHKDIFSKKLLFWLNSAQTSYMLPEVIALVAVAILAGVVIKIRSTKTGPNTPQSANPKKLIGFAALSHICIALTLYSLSINEENRFLLPMLPALAVLILICLTPIKSTLIFVLISIAFIYQWGAVHVQAMAIRPPDPRISYWVWACDRDSNQQKEVTKIVERTSNPKTAQKTNVVGVELPWLNSNSLAFFAAKRQFETGSRAFYTSLGYTENNIERAWQRFESLNPPYFITLSESKQSSKPDVFNAVSIPILQRISTDERFEQIPFRSKLGVMIYKR